MNKKICIVGLGYVGLPLAVAFAEKYEVIGFDIDRVRIDELENGVDRTLEMDPEELISVNQSLTYTDDILKADCCSIYVVTVPTPIDARNKPDLTPLLSASRTLGQVLNSGDIVIYESTVYPGVTEEICAKELEIASGLKLNVDFYCGYSPERINPGDKEHTVKNILKVTSGSTPEVAKTVDELYRDIITAGTHLASSIKVAEASKVIENTQRDVNIALINELAMIFNEMGIDTGEVLAAAATKWNFIKLSPGLVGGHCIGVDPYYLTYRAEELGYKPNLILASRQINNGMGSYVAEQTIRRMIKSGCLIKGSNLLLMGLTFKENCPDIRNTKVFDIIEYLVDLGVNVDIYDPWVTTSVKDSLHQFRFNDDPLKSRKKYDSIVIAVAHNEFLDFTSNEFASISKSDSPLVIDIKGIYPNATWTL